MGETTRDDLCAVGVVFWYPGDGAKPYDEGPMNRLNRLNLGRWIFGWFFLVNRLGGGGGGGVELGFD